MNWVTAAAYSLRKEVAKLVLQLVSIIITYS